MRLTIPAHAQAKQQVRKYKASCFFVYVLGATDLPFFKIGYSVNPKERARHIGQFWPYGVDLVWKRCFEHEREAQWVEDQLHGWFFKTRTKRGRLLTEWFKLAPEQTIDQVVAVIETVSPDATFDANAFDFHRLDGLMP